MREVFYLVPVKLLVLLLNDFYSITQKINQEIKACRLGKLLSAINILFGHLEKTFQSSYL